MAWNMCCCYAVIMGKKSSIDFSLDSGWNETLFVKIGRIVGLWIGKSLGLNWPKTSFQATDP